MHIHRRDVMTRYAAAGSSGSRISGAARQSAGTISSGWTFIISWSRLSDCGTEPLRSVSICWPRESREFTSLLSFQRIEEGASQVPCRTTPLEMNR